MLPMEAKVDSNGLLYIDDELIKRHPINLRDNPDKKTHSFFYELFSTSDYIVKYSNNPINRNKLMEMLLRFQKLQSIISKIDFPIGYYKEENRIKGTIIRYYKDSPSLYFLSETHDINILGKYYYHDDDIIHNLYQLMYETLLLIEELFENNIYYTDVHRGNFLIDNNTVKLIDFDYNFVQYKEKRDKALLQMVLRNYDDMLFFITKRFGLGEILYYQVNSFDGMRKKIQKVEDKVRKGKHYV